MIKITPLIITLAIITTPFNLLANSLLTNESKQSIRAPLHYSGWAVLKRNIIDPSADDDDWISMHDIKMSDDGKRLRFMDGENETPYIIELIEIAYKKSNTTVLKLALYEDGKEPAFTYIWGESGAYRLGLNLGWIQVGLTRDAADRKTS